MKINNRKEFHKACERYLHHISRDKGGAWNRHAHSATNLRDAMIGYALRMVRDGRASIEQAVMAMPTEKMQLRLCDYFIGKPEDAYVRALRSCDKINHEAA